jgi:flagellar protein FlbD
MIELTKLNKKKFLLNCELIETVESTPDTVITLRNGKLLIVTEPPDQILEMMMAYKRAMFSDFFSPSSHLPLIVKREEEEDDEA